MWPYRIDPHSLGVESEKIDSFPCAVPVNDSYPSFHGGIDAIIFPKQIPWAQSSPYYTFHPPPVMMIFVHVLSYHSSQLATSSTIAVSPVFPSTDPYGDTAAETDAASDVFTNAGPHATLITCAAAGKTPARTLLLSDVAA